MLSGKFVFTQLIESLPRHEFAKCVERYRGNHRARRFRCWDQFMVMAFAQLTFRESLRDIEICLRSMPRKLYHAGIRGTIAHSTLADANEHRDWRIWADFAGVLIAQARTLHAQESPGIRLKADVYVFDTTTIDLCLTLFPWAQFRRHKSAVRLHTLLDLRGNIPCFISVTEGSVHELNLLGDLPLEAGALLKVELFFKWIKQYLRIKTFFGNTPNAVKTQVWIAISVYLLVVIERKRLGLSLSMGEIMQILSLTLFDKTPILQVLSQATMTNQQCNDANPLPLLDI